MINNKEITMEINENDVIIKVNGTEKLKVSINKKSINTKDIYELLEYDVNNKYSFNCTPKEKSELQGIQGEINRLYNYIYELLDKIVTAVDDINENERAERAKEDNSLLSV